MQIVIVVNKSPFSFLRMLTTWYCPHSPAAAAAIDRDLLPAVLTAANLQQRVCCCGPMLGQTNGQTDGYRTVDRPCFAYYVGSANNSRSLSFVSGTVRYAI